MNLFTSSTFSCDIAREVSPRSTQDSLPRDGSPSYRFVTSRWCVSRKGGAVRPSHLASSPRPERRSGLAKIEQAPIGSDCPSREEAALWPRLRSRALVLLTSASVVARSVGLRKAAVEREPARWRPEICVCEEPDARPARSALLRRRSVGCRICTRRSQPQPGQEATRPARTRAIRRAHPAARGLRAR